MWGADVTDMVWSPRLSAHRRAGALAVAVAVCLGTPLLEVSASAEPVATCSTAILSTTPVYGALTTTGGRSTATVKKVSSTSKTMVRRLKSGSWTAKVTVTTKVRAIARRPVSAKVGAQLTAAATVVCGARSVTFVRSNAATGSVARSLTVTETRKYKATKSGTRSSRKSAVAYAKRLAVVDALVRARAHACRSVSAVSTSPTRSAARDRAQVLAGNAARNDARMTAETELTAFQPN